MKLVSFSVPYTEDKRMVYAAEYLERHGFIYKQNIDESDFVLLPVPVKKEMLDSLNGKFAFYGKGEYKNGFDYMKDETYVLKNALLTAEGAVACLEENTDYSLIGKNILIIGYGRIAKALRKILSSYGSNITVCSRSSISKAEAAFDGVKHISFSELKNKSDYDIVINTVPHIVLTKEELTALKKSVLILDLASFPGGVDTLVANSLGLKLINGRGMPSVYTQKTAGEIIGEAVVNIIKGEKL